MKRLIKLTILKHHLWVCSVRTWLQSVHEMLPLDREGGGERMRQGLHLIHHVKREGTLILANAGWLEYESLLYLSISGFIDMYTEKRKHKATASPGQHVV